MDNTKKARIGGDHPHTSMIDILAANPIKIADKHLLNLAINQNVQKEFKGTYKILQFSSDWNFEEVSTFISSLNSKDYSKLFIVVIHVENSNESEAIHENFKKNLLKFGTDRPLVLQLISTDQKIYFKSGSSNVFIPIDAKQQDDSIKNFPTFLCALLNGNVEVAIYEAINSLSTLQNSSLIVRFLRLLEFDEEFFRILILKSAENGTKNDFLAALDAPFDSDGKKLSTVAQKILSTVFEDDQSEDDSDDEAQMKDEPQKHSKSVLLTAIEHKNKEVIDFLVTSWSSLIQKLPFDHQVRNSTAAFETGQLDVLCDLLDIADFPFPEYFKPDTENGHERLNKIVEIRTKLAAAIADGNFDKVEELIKKNSSLKICYSINNNSALKEAINSNKLAIFFFLKTFAYKADDCVELLEKISDKDKQRALRQAAAYKNASVSHALKNNQQSVLLLATKSYIHNKRLTKEQETEYRKKIRQWYESINKVAAAVLDVAVTCDYLKIIYDFESETVENVSLSGPNSPGVTYVSSKWIFIGAKTTGRDRELEITGVLAQQICYYVLHLVFDNNGKPYYKESLNLAEIFEDIVKSIDQWSGQTVGVADDECFGMISSVFTSYSPKDFHAELILRVLNILTEFDADPEYLSHIQQKYKNLFSFWYEFVVPELKLYLQKEEDTVRLNSYFGVLPRIKEQKIELLEPKDFKDILKSNITIISSNIPTLLLIDIYTNLKKSYGCLLDTKNIFADPEKYQNHKIRGDFQQICRHNSDMNVYVDCSKGDLESIDLSFANKKHKFVFIVSNEKHRDALVNVALKVCGTNPELLELNYNWLNLTTKSHKILLKFKINFQNNETLSLLDVLESPNDLQDAEGNAVDMQQVFNGYSEIMGDQLMNLVIEGEKVAVNSKLVVDLSDKKFEFLFKIVKFVRKVKDDPKVAVDPNEAELPKITADDLIKSTKNKPHVLISDIAGTGKSWGIKNLSKVLKDKYPTRWVTYVDIKEYTKLIKAQKVQPEFTAFLTEKILKLKNKFEIKIFQKLYKDGKVCIIFDGFDEIAPDYAKFVTKFMKSFEINGGNQLWIVTRDYFEADLQQKFQIDEVFKLDDFPRDFGVELIAKCWIIAESRDLSVKNFDEQVKKSPKIESYQKIADKIVQKVEKINKKPILGPLVYKMISKTFKDGRCLNINVEDPNLVLNRFKIFRSVIIHHYKIWSDKKGEIRREANIRSQEYELNFWRFHQYAAILILFPDKIAKVFPYYEPSEWILEEIIACGMMEIKDGQYSFLNDDLRDFFVAELVTKELIRKRLKKEIVLEVFVRIMTSSSCRGVQVMLNDAIKDEPSYLVDHGQKFSELADEYCKMDNFDDYFNDELDELIKMVVDILKSGDHEKVKDLLARTAVKLIKSVKNEEVYRKFEKVLFNFLQPEELKALIKEQDIILRIAQSNLDVEVFENLVTKLETMYGIEFIKDILSNKGTELEVNIMFMLCISANNVQLRFTNFLPILQKYFTKLEIKELMNNCNQNDETVLHVCVQKDDEELLKIVWTEIQNLFDSQVCKEFAMKKAFNNQNSVLHYAASNTKIEVHTILWNLLRKTFEDREELKDLMLQKDHEGCNFLHLLVSNSAEILELTIKFIKENFNNDQLKYILEHNNAMGQNLIQFAARSSKDLKTHQILWKILQEVFKSSDNFIKIFKEVDSEGNNVLHLAVSFATSDIFEFINSELEKNLKLDELKNYLKKVNAFSQNLLQLAAMHNKSKELHKSLWKTIRKYLDSFEISVFINHDDENENDLLSYAENFNSKEILNLTLSEIQISSNQDTTKKNKKDFAKKKNSL